MRIGIGLDLSTNSLRGRQGGAGGASFPITEGLVSWYDASQETYSNDEPVTVLSDRYGENHFEQNTELRQPIFKTEQLNGLPVINFNQDYLEYGGEIIPGTGNLTIILLTKDASDSNFPRVVLATDNRFDWRSVENLSGTPQRLRIDATNILTGNNVVGSFIVKKIIRKSDGWEMRENNTVSDTSSSSANARAHNKTTLGADDGGGNYFFGDFCEMAVFNRDLSNEEMASLQSYFNDKWGL